MFVALICAGLALRLAGAVLFQGSPDVGNLISGGTRLLQGEPLYSAATTGGMTPIGYVFPALAIAAGRTVGLPDYVSAKLPNIAADMAGVCLVLLLGRGLFTSKLRWTIAAFLMLNPVSVIASAYHGNIEPVVNACAIGAVLLLVRGERWDRWLSALALALALVIKPYPILYLPLFALVPGRWRDRIGYGAVAVLPLAVLMPLFVLSQPAFSQFFAYHSYYGNWGVPLILQQSQNVLSYLVSGRGTTLLSTLQSLNQWLTLYGRYLLLLALATYVGLLIRMRDLGRQHLARNVTGALLVFYVVTTGFGVQYLSWIVPFLALYHLGKAALYTLAVAPYMVLSYLQFLMPARYGVVSVTHNLRLLSPGDLTILVAAGLCGVAAWGVCCGLMLGHLRQASAAVSELASA